MNRLYGCDFSHWNSADVFKSYVEKSVWFAHKLTEGVDFVDEEAEKRLLNYMDSKPAIAYHVIRPSFFEKQFCHFFDQYKKIIDASEKKRLGVMVDFELNYWNPISIETLIDAIVTFGNFVETNTTARPIIYIADTYHRSVYQTIKEHDWLLWIARYSGYERLNNIPDIWQYAADVVDHNTFFGTLEKLHSCLDWRKNQ